MPIKKTLGTAQCIALSCLSITSGLYPSHDRSHYWLLLKVQIRSSYWTTSVTVVECVSRPDVPVTLMT
jgi:hypothetical protein